MTVEGNSWTYAEYDFLYKNYNQLGPIDCAKHLNRPLDAVNSKAEKLELCISGPFTDEEIQYARSFGNILKGSMIFLLPHRTSHEVEELIKCSKQRQSP